MTTPTQTPIAAAVLPLKQEAVKRAEQFAREHTDRLIAKLTEAGYDLQLAAPWPSSHDPRYFTKKNLHNAIQSIVRHTKASRRMNDPDPVVVDQDRVDNFIETAKVHAAAQYDFFVAKLEGKAGAHTAATLTGDHVWGYSVLTVTLPDGSSQRWKTQMILNISKLGLVFNQWPSRKLER